MRFGSLMRLAIIGVAAAAVAATAATAAVVGLQKKKPLKGLITADGSSTVGPYTIAAAEMFRKHHRGVQITVGISGTGGGFERFCNNETDLSDASRPIKSEEAKACRGNGVRYVPFRIANDGVSLVVNKKNTWAKCLSVDQLHRIWQPGSNVNNWHDISSKFPKQSLKLFGPGTDSGTFDFFTEKINGKAGASRSDYTASENDNVLVQGVEGEKGALGYFGYSYYAENKDRLRVVKVNAGKGCVGPSKRTVQRNKYRPLSRPLYIYAKKPAFRRREVRAFIGYVFGHERTIANRSKLISLTIRQLKKARRQYKKALKELRVKNP